MARLKKDELLTELKAYTGDRTDDDTLKIIEDVSDSLEPEEKDADAPDWESKYNDLAKKYKDRFTSPETNKEKDDADGSDDKGDGESETDSEEITISDLFEDA